MYAAQAVTTRDIDLLIKGINLLHSKLEDAEKVNQSEEAIVNLFSDFLKSVWYNCKKETYNVNSIDRIDVAIHHGSKASDPIGVLLEAKRKSNKAEFPKDGNLSCKALYELLRYYLRQRNAGQNQIRHLVITNGWEWYILDENWFDKNAWQNKELVANFNRYETDKTTDLFYSDIARKFFESSIGEMTYTYFDLTDYLEAIKDEKLFEVGNVHQAEVASLYKLLAPQYLLKKPLQNDSNSLNKEFYNELLHIMGLEERKVKGLPLIKRLPVSKRNRGSFLELAINQLNDPQGVLTDEDKFELGLELILTWVNRVLFLKLLEAHQLQINSGISEFKFLTKEKIISFDWLNALFFEVLAKKYEERPAPWQERFSQVPYLNSSLYEPTETEEKHTFISGLIDHETMPIFSATVLKDHRGNKIEGRKETLDYFFAFLDAYNFGADIYKSEIKTEVKTLINAAVLGLIFEKINGYKEGSIYTPGHITMYMCRDSIRRVVIEKFNNKYGWSVSDFEELKNSLSKLKREDVLAYNEIINSINICDPSVGSGHFLVSALNEIIACKSELNILADESGSLLSQWDVRIENDELLITSYSESYLFKYKKNTEGKISVEYQRVMETLFKEKRRCIEHSLFGVDINPNSVKICRLRLWIELLKNSYYTKESNYKELETLPNIDINIKVGNSLVSKLKLDDNLNDFAPAHRQWIKKTIPEIKKWYELYYSTETINGRKTIIKKIKDASARFQAMFDTKDKDYLAYDKKKNELMIVSSAAAFSEPEVIDRVANELIELEAKWKTKMAVYNFAFEWRYEFPQVLNDDGDYIGFDLVIGNPPYIRQEELGLLQKQFYTTNYQVGNNSADIVVYFFELGNKIAKTDTGKCSLITTNKWMKASYGKELRKYILDYKIYSIIDYNELRVFDSAATFPAVFQFAKEQPTNTIPFLSVKSLEYTDLDEVMKKESLLVSTARLSDESWELADDNTRVILDKLREKGVKLGHYTNNEIYYGIKTGFNEAFILSNEQKEAIIESDKNAEEVIKPALRGDYIRKFQVHDKKEWIILSKKGIEIEKYPSVYNHLLKYKSSLEQKAGDSKWYELQSNIAYSELFEKPKIIYPDIAKASRFHYDAKGYYFTNTAYFIALDSKWLAGLMNSKLIYFYFSYNSNSLGDPRNGGRLRWFTQDVQNIPIVEPDQNTQGKLTALVDKIMSAKVDNPNAETLYLEAEIDTIVYELYDLTPDEIAVVEAG